MLNLIGSLTGRKSASIQYGATVRMEEGIGMRGTHPLRFAMVLSSDVARGMQYATGLLNPLHKCTFTDRLVSWDHAITTSTLLTRDKVVMTSRQIVHTILNSLRF
jgi:hypothetical protein